MAEDAPRTEDFACLREHLWVMEKVYARAEAAAQSIGYQEGAQACARRRRLARELVEWLDASEELGEFVVAAARARHDVVAQRDQYDEHLAEALRHA